MHLINGYGAEMEATKRGGHFPVSAVFCLCPLRAEEIREDGGQVPQQFLPKNARWPLNATVHLTHRRSPWR